MNWELLWLIIACIVIALLFSGAVVICVVLSNVKSRIDNGASEEGIKKNEVTFGYVMSIILAIGLGLLFLYTIWRAIKVGRNNSRAKSILTSGSSLTAVAASNGAVNAAGRTIIPLTQNAAVNAATATANTASETIISLTDQAIAENSGEPATIESLNAIRARFLNTLPQAARQGADTAINQANPMVSNAINVIGTASGASAGAAANNVAAAAESALSGGEAARPEMPTVSPLQPSLMPYATMNLSSIEGGAINLGQIPIQEETAIGLPIGGNFVNDPRFNNYLVGNPIPNLDNRCTEGGNPPCGHRRDWLRNLAYLPPGGYQRTAFRS